MGSQSSQDANKAIGPTKAPPGLKPKDMCLIPQRLALALQADGWYVRDDIPWVKAWMKTDDVPMWDMPVSEVLEGSAMPGSQTDRPTSSWEHILLLSKSRRYYFDSDAIRAQSGAIFRNVWRINPKSYKGAHFATFAPDLPKYAILFGTSERGVCPECGAPWVRVVEKGENMLPVFGGKDRTGQEKHIDDVYKKNSQIWLQWKKDHPDKFLGWLPSCECEAGEPVPATVLDPFIGSGTTALVARQLGRNCVGLDLSGDYLRTQARKRLSLDALDAWQSGAPVADGGGLAGLPMFEEIE